ncbi:cysteine--tRNA ligase [Acutalibacter caecimuris]|uniref:cysteine--tRNA ligase n=1 Tax=Acutalibacter caecimuris TaxID=3093657 RepID=UPI002AC99F14|nr:cysteine--tRNA ligase [Acutalibacter sp. M00118]
MQLINSLSMKKEEIIPHEAGKIRMYTCGPTVYGFAHIGNLRSYIMEDVLEKALCYEGYAVDRVMNITDVGHLTSDADTGEDKMLKGARREHKSVLELAAFYTDAFFADCQKLNIRRPGTVVPATGCIDDFIQMVAALLDKGYAYLAGGNVYFDTAKLENYYVFGNQNADDLAVGVRDSVEADSNKRSKTDFVLWFTKSKFDDQELKWESPWGLGYPGWHIECSAISIKNLGGYLDIHCGGIDNAFPHHTNEIAQSEAYLGHPWCKYWFHVLHLNDAGGKISKSRGAKLTVSLLEEKGYNPLVYRLFNLQSHYRKPLTFSFESLDNAANAYQKLVSRVASLAKDGQPDTQAAQVWQARFREALCNDLNTSQALTVLYNMLKSDLDDATKRFLVGDFDQVLSLDLLAAGEKAGSQNSGVPAALAEEIESLLEKRAAARKAKDWSLADAIRDELAARRVVLKDTPQGVEWHIKA